MTTSPFLQREQQRPREHRYAGNARRDRDMRDRWMAACLLEKLRYQQWVKHGKVGAVMQGMGDWSRQNTWFPIVFALFAYGLFYIGGWW